MPFSHSPDEQEHYDPFRGSEMVTVQELLAEVFEDIFDADGSRDDSFSGDDPLTVNSHLWADEDRPLHLIARRGNARCVRLLLEAGADPNALGDMSMTPLHYAMRGHHLEVARLLLEAGAKVDVIDEFDSSALGRCSPNGFSPDPEMFQLLQFYWPDVVPEDIR